MNCIFLLRTGLCCILLFLINLYLLVYPLPGSAQDISIVSPNGEKIYLYKNYYALVIGVSTYDVWEHMPDASRDAKDVFTFLKGKGVEAELLIDPDSRHLRDALKNLVQLAGQETDRGIILYYSGRSVTQNLAGGKKMGWIIPRDCPRLIEDPDTFTEKAISIKELTSYASQVLSRHMIMFFDSSFSSSDLTAEVPVLETILHESALPVRQFIIAGMEGDPVPEKNIYKNSLIRGLNGDADLVYDGYITGAEIGVFLRDTVLRNSLDRRHPRYGKFKSTEAEQGDFVFHFSKSVSEKSRVFVHTEPEGADIRVLNIRPRFYQGMDLSPGKYHIEVSAAGYSASRKWIELYAGVDRTVDIKLTKFSGTYTNSLGMKFVFIKPGSFTMGSSGNEPGAFHDEKGHRVIISKGYYLQTTEVTVGQFRKFVKDTGYKTEGETSGGCWISSGSGWKKSKGSNWEHPGSWETTVVRQTENHPVTCVSWNDATAFIHWTNKNHDVTFFLPTEAEWEYAIRAGTTTPFAFGDCLSTDQANYGNVGLQYSDCGSGFMINRKSPIQTGTLKPNQWGLFNMHGNVSEWSQDWYGTYPDQPVSDPRGPSSGADRVLRGGHWLATLTASRSSKRSHFQPDFASDVIGFRLVMKP